MSEHDEGRPTVICGAGAAGLAAALAAARSGSPVLLVEAGADVGGTMAGALLHTLAGLYDARGDLVNDGLARELAERLAAADERVQRRRMGKLWVMSVDPDSYRRVVRSWLQSEPRIRTLFGARPREALRAGGAVRELEITGGRGVVRVRPRALIDATGSGALVAGLQPGALIDDREGAAGGWIFRMRGVAVGAFAFPRNVGVVRALREHAAAGALPPECEHAWVDSGIYEDEVFVKLLVPLAAGWQEREGIGEISAGARRTQDRVVAFLRTLPGFEAAVVTQTGTLGVRDGGRVRGEYVLSRDDVLGLRKFEDAACRCAWPIEYWDSLKGVSLEYLPEGGSYDIPLRALKARGLDNVWMAGKCLSADRHAQASARTVGTCWAMGEAAGKAAAAL